MICHIFILFNLYFSQDEIKYRRFLAGSLAGVTSQSLTYPLDLARARMAVTHDSEFARLKEVCND